MEATMSYRFISKSSSIRSMMLKMMISIFILTTCALSILLYFEARSYAIHEAEKKIKNLLLEHQAMNEYITKHQKPEIAKLKQEGKLDKNYFSPEILSASYIAKSMHHYYNEQRGKNGLSDTITSLLPIIPEIRRTKAMSSSGTSSRNSIAMRLRNLSR